MQSGWLRPGSLLLVVIPGSVFAWIAIDSARRALERAVGRQLAEVAQDTAERVEAEIGRVEGDVQSWAQKPPLRAVTSMTLDDELSRFLSSLERNDLAVHSLAAIDRRGHIVGSTDPALLGDVVVERPWWAAVTRGETAVIGLDGDRDSRASFQVAAPIFATDGSSAVVGAVLAEYPWEHVESVLLHSQHDLASLGLEVTILVLDGGGRVVAGGWWDEPSPYAKQNLRAAGWRTEQLARETSRPSYTREKQADALVGYAAIELPHLGLVALVVQPLVEAFAPVRALQRNLLLTFGGVLLAGLALATLIAERLSRPIRELTEATRELARTGATPHPVVARSRDEIGNLAESFNRMAVDLTRARDDLLSAAKFALLGELAAGMAHEIRTPLGILRSSAQILGRGLPPADQRSGELIEMIVSEVDRLDRLVDGLLEIARPHEPMLESTRLEPVLSRALDLVATQATERGITLQRDFPPQERAARCDPEQIYQVALNLIVNALQNVPRGGTVRVRTFTHGEAAGFEVIDDGPGIPRDIQERVFTPFFTRRPGGTGLGLALVQRIVATHHGAVSLTSEVGHGATFRVELPAAEETR